MGVVCCDLLKNSEILALGVIRGSYFPGKGSRPRTSWEIASLNNQTTIPLRIFEKCIDHRFHRSPALPWRRARSFRRLFRCRYFCVEETVAFHGPRNVSGGGGGNRGKFGPRSFSSMSLFILIGKNCDTAAYPGCYRRNIFCCWITKLR